MLDSWYQSFAIGGGNGTCGFYDSVNQLGCLFMERGAEQNNPTIETAGWLKRSTHPNPSINHIKSGYDCFP
ncbi:hypothetical protein Pst134EB_010127 [Puccinia striiformis f. sp. tritici]|nr:hypothetical protein Pst134EB_010127 [Puccinia striiformis f. sp. tritici]